MLSGLAAGCASAPGLLEINLQTEFRTEKPETPGVSGKPPTPAAAVGQTLPLKPARTISFETREGTHLSLDVSPDGASIVFDMLGDLYLLGIEGGVAERLTSGPALDTQPVFSPDGESILFLSDRSGAENLWLMDPDGRNPRQISFHDDNPAWVSPEWSPDGERIIVSRFWSDRNAYELWEFDASPGAMGRVLRSTEPESETGNPVSSLGAHFGPGGQTIYLASLREETAAFDELSAWTVIAVDQQTGEKRTLAGDRERPAFRPRISPDARHLAYAERRGNRTFLQVRDLAGGNTVTLGQLDPDSLQASLWHDAVPRFDFTPDGEALIVNTGGNIMRYPVAGGAPVTIRFSARVEQYLPPLVRSQIPVEDGPVRARLIMSPDLSPDGRTVAFSALGNIYTKSFAADAAERLTGELVSTYHPSWSPDGKRLTFVSWSAEAGGHVWIANRDGSGLRQITTEPAFYTHPVLVPDGSAIITVQSSREDRNRTYMEYGQLRDAQLVYLPLDGSASHILASGDIGGRPHFGPVAGTVLINSDKGVETISLETGERTVLTQAVGPNWYFAEGAAPANDLRVSPDGQWALAEIAHQLHLYRIPDLQATSVNLADPATLHTRLTDIGVDYFGWARDGGSIFWSVGSTIYHVPLDKIEFEAGRTIPIETAYDVVHKVDVTKPRAQAGHVVLLTGATVFPMDERENPARMIEHADILLKYGEIAALGPGGEVHADKSIPRIDLSGTFIIPGLIDAHYHVADIRRSVLQLDSWGLKTNLAYGITTLFDPSTLSIDMLTYQDLVDAGDIEGSRLYTTGPAIFDFYDFRSQAQVEAVLRRYRDHYRTLNLKQYRAGNRRVRQWLAQAADELDMTPTAEGALSFKLGLSQILDGYSGNEHALPPPALHKDVTELFARSGTSSTLTLMITHGGAPADESFIARRNPANSAKYARFAPDWFIEREFADVPKPADEDFLYKTVAESAHRIFEAGGVVGLGAHGDLPGLGTIWEAEAYVEGGWSPAEAIWAATMGSATTIARDESLGSLSAGKKADLVVLRDNPMTDIRALEDVIYVMKDGHLYSGMDLTEHPLTRSD